jgi:hypothetical protein
MSIRRMLLMMSAAGVLTTACAVAQTTTTSSTATRQSTSAPIGLAGSETRQVNVTNTATASSSGRAASCTGAIGFVNSSGTAIGSATSFTVTSGQTFSASLPFNKVAASGTRAEIRGVVTVTESTGSGAAPCQLTTSLETFDTATGVTHVYQANGIQGNGGGPCFGH